MTEYNEDVSDYGDLLKVNEFIECCKCGGFIDDDGFGHPVKENKMNGDIFIYPSKLDTIPKDATYIIWYNK